MLRLFRSVWIWTASAVLVLLWTPLLAVVRLFDRDPRRFRTGRWFRRLGRALARINPWEIRISGLENLVAGQVYVIVSNHQSMADIPVISHLDVDAKWLVKAELFRLPFLGWMLRMAGDVPVERSDRPQRREGAVAMRPVPAAWLLHRLFSRRHAIARRRGPAFQRGALPVGHSRERTPILPLVVEGSSAALPRNSWIFGDPRAVDLHVLRPVSVEGWDGARGPELRDQVRQQMADELRRLRGSVADR